MAHILVIDDEAAIRRFLRISLIAEGHQVSEAVGVTEGMAQYRHLNPDLVILDLGLPDRDGREVLQELRQWSNVPLIVLTVRSGETEKVALLDAGANDYVTKPFGVEELLARIRALLRMAGLRSEPAPVYDDGTLRVDLAAREVSLHGQAVGLTRKEFALLTLLVRQPGRLITQTQLLRDMWGPTHVEDAHYLRVLVGKLRQKLGEDASAPRYIITEPGVGLRFLPQEP